MYNIMQPNGGPAANCEIIAWVCRNVLPHSPVWLHSVFWCLGQTQGDALAFVQPLDSLLLTVGANLAHGHGPIACQLHENKQKVSHHCYRAFV